MTTDHNSEPTYRVRIEGELEVVTELHLGDGDSLPMLGRKNPAGDATKEGHYNTTCVDKDSHPYLPGSSLRGSLLCVFNAVYKSPSVDEDGTASANGSITNETESKSNAEVNVPTDPPDPQLVLFGSSKQGGQLRVFNAVHKSSPVDGGGTSSENGSTKASARLLPYWDNTRKTCLRHGVNINPITRTAKAHHLFMHEMVPVGTRFAVTLELHAANYLIEHQTLQNLLNTLKAWQDISLGSGNTKGWGQVRWDVDKQKIKVVTSCSLKKWLESPEEQPLPWLELRQSEPNGETDKTSINTVQIRLIANGPFLVNEAGLVKQGDGKPCLKYSRTQDGRARIPASSLKGWVRSQAHKIAATIAHQDNNVKAEQAWNHVASWIDALFGNEKQRGRLVFSDAISEEEPNLHRQFFNAIDRFTGGVTEGALYNVEAAYCDECNPLVTRIQFDSEFKDNLAWQGLLLLVLRDVMAGELYLGWGQARGYGKFAVQVKRGEQWITCFEDLLKNSEHMPKDANDCIKKLHEAIKKHVETNRKNRRQHEQI